MPPDTGLARITGLSFSAITGGGPRLPAPPVAAGSSGRSVLSQRVHRRRVGALRAPRPAALRHPAATATASAENFIVFRGKHTSGPHSAVRGWRGRRGQKTGSNKAARLGHSEAAALSRAARSLHGKHARTGAAGSWWGCRGPGHGQGEALRRHKGRHSSTHCGRIKQTQACPGGPRRAEENRADGFSWNM